MRIWSERRAAVAFATAALAAGIAVAASCSRSADSAGGGDAGAGRPDTSNDAEDGSPADSADGEVTDAIGEYYPACDPDPHSPLVPAGWVRFPALPCQCTVWVAPSVDLMTAAPKWVQSPEGWLELDDPQSGDPGAASPVSGSNYDGLTEIAYARTVQRGTQENVVLDVAAGHYVYDERVVGTEHFDIPCYSKLEATAQGVTSHHSWVASTANTTFSILSATSAQEPLPVPFQKEVDEGYVAFAVGAKVAAAVPSSDRLDAFSLDPTKGYHGAWMTDGRIIDYSTPLGWDSTIFFGVYALDATKQFTEQYLAWDAAQGVRPFVGTAPGASAARSACGLGTDGKTLVWTELADWDGQGWQTANVMQAPFTTDGASLKPQLVRAAPGLKKAIGRWIVDGDYAATSWGVAETPKPLRATFVVRLSDGAAWQLDTPGVQLVPLYLTATEMAAAEQFDTPQDGGPDGYRTWRIARYPLSLLGPPNLP